MGSDKTNFTIQYLCTHRRKHEKATQNFFCNSYNPSAFSTLFTHLLAVNNASTIIMSLNNILLVIVHIVLLVIVQHTICRVARTILIDSMIHYNLMDQSHGLLNRVPGTISSLLIHSMSSDYNIIQHTVLYTVIYNPYLFGTQMNTLQIWV